MFAYLDNSATTKPCPEAVAAMVEALETGWGQPQLSVPLWHGCGPAAEGCPEQVAKALGAESDRVFFTSAAPRRTIGRWPPLWPEWASRGGM